MSLCPPVHCEDPWSEQVVPVCHQFLSLFTCLLITPMSCLPNVPLVCFLVVSLTVIKVSPHAPGKLTGHVNPKAANHLRRNSQCLLTRMVLPLPGQTVSMVVFPFLGAVSRPFKDIMPSCLSQTECSFGVSTNFQILISLNSTT